MCKCCAEPFFTSVFALGVGPITFHKSLDDLSKPAAYVLARDLTSRCPDR